MSYARGACGVVLVLAALVLTFAGLFFAGMSDAIYTRRDVLGWGAASAIAALILMFTGGMPEFVLHAKMVAFGIGCLLAAMVGRGLLLGVFGI